MEADGGLMMSLSVVTTRLCTRSPSREFTATDELVKTQSHFTEKRPSYLERSLLVCQRGPGQTGTGTTAYIGYMLWLSHFHGPENFYLQLR